MLIAACDGIQIIDHVLAVNAKCANSFDALKPILIAGPKKVYIFVFLILGKLIPVEKGILETSTVIIPFFLCDHKHIGVFDLFLQFFRKDCL